MHGVSGGVNWGVISDEVSLENLPRIHDVVRVQRDLDASHQRDRRASCLLLQKPDLVQADSMLAGTSAAQAPGDGVEDLASETLFLDGAVVIASSRHPLARRARVKMESILAHDWILPAEDTSFHQQIGESIRKAGLPLPAARITSYSMLAFPAIVATSNLLGLLPTSLFASGTLSASLNRLPVAMDWVPWPVGVLMRKDMVDRHRLDGLLAILRTVAASARVAVSQR